MLDQDTLGDTLLAAVHGIASDPKKAAQMRENIRLLHIPDASLRIANIMAQSLDKTGNGA